MLGKLIKNTVSNFILKILSITLNIILIPVVVKTVGADGYGLMVLATGIMGNLTILDFGFGKGNLRYVAEYKAKGESDTVFRIVNTSFSLFLLFGVFVAVVISILILTDIITVFQTGSLHLEFIHLLWIAASISIISWPAKILDSTLKGLNEYHLNNIALSAGYILSPLLTIMAALLGMSLEVIFAVQNLSYLFSWILQFYFLKQKLLGWKFNPFGLNRKVLSEIFNLSFMSFLSQLASVLLYQADRIILGIFLPVSALTAYRVITLPFQYIGVVTNLASSAILPKITSDFVQKGEGVMDKYYYTGSRYSNIISATASVLVILFAHPFVDLWMGAEYLEYVWIIQVACLLQIVWKSNMFLGKALFGYGRITELALIAIFIGLLNIPISIALIPVYGVGGVVFGTLIVGFVSILLQYIFVFPKFKIKLLKYWKEVILFGQSPAILLGLVLWLSAKDLFEGISNLGVLIGALTGISGLLILIYWWVSVEKEHKLKLRTALKV